jgi:hypothetical protein
MGRPASSWQRESVRFAVGAAVFSVLSFARVALAQDAAQMVRDYAPRVVLHPEERYALSNIDYFFSKFRLVLTTAIKTHERYDVTRDTLATIHHSGWVKKYNTTEVKWKDNWSFESKEGCEWKTETAACDKVYLRAENPVRTYLAEVTPEVYWRAKDRVADGKTYTVIQFFFFLMLNDAQNKHEGEWESSVVVVDKEAYAAAGDDVAKKRRAITQILMAGHYRHDPYPQEVLAKHEKEIFVDSTAHYRHVMSLGGHGGYLFVPESGTHEASAHCYEKIRASDNKYDIWSSAVKLVQVDDSTPWVNYVGRWGRHYGLFSKFPISFRFSFKPVGVCAGKFGLGWLKSRFQVINSAPFGPKFIHQTVWNWTNFPQKPAETPKSWR